VAWQAQQLSLILDDRHKTLKRETPEQDLQQALAQHLEEPLSVTIQVQTFDAWQRQQTPAYRRQQADLERRQQALQNLRDDPLVQALQNTFAAVLDEKTLRLP